MFFYVLHHVFYGVLYVLGVRQARKAIRTQQRERSIAWILYGAPRMTWMDYSTVEIKNLTVGYRSR